MRTIPRETPILQCWALPRAKVRGIAKDGQTPGQMGHYGEAVSANLPAHFRPATTFS